MALSFLSASRTVLLVTDEALYIYASTPKSTKLVDAVPWDAAGFEQNVSTLLSKACGGKPVLILTDTVEQHYRKERVPKVGLLDKTNVIGRKLRVAFPNYDVRAALPLKEKAGSGAGGVQSSVYIFAAIPATENFNKTVAAVQASLVSIFGVGLLPVESSDLVKKLAAHYAKKTQKQSQWTVFVGQHKNGSLRQVVTKNGELALTRMTPIIESDENPEHWANELNQELKATMSYLSRFGYTPQDGLDVIVVANERAGSVLGGLIDASCNYIPVTVNQAAHILGLSIGKAVEDHYADILHVAWAGQKKKLTLPMGAKQVSSVAQPRKMAIAASALLLLGSGYLAYQLLDAYQSLSGIRGDIVDTKQRITQLDAQYLIEVKRKEEMGFDVELVQNSLLVYDLLEEHKINAMYLIKAVGDSLGRDLRIDQFDVVRDKKIEWPKGEDGNAGFGFDGQKPKKVPVFNVTLQMTYPSTTDIDKGNEEVRALRDRLQEQLPNHGVKVQKFLKDYEYTEQIIVEAGAVDGEDIVQDFVVVIGVEGPRK